MYVVVLVVGWMVLGLIVRSWWALFLPLVAIPLFYVGLNQGWWGNGTGDRWETVAILATGIAVAATAAGVALSQAVRSSRLS